MSTEHQKYSIGNQSAVIADYASKRGFEVVKTYKDEGVSGLGIAKRTGLKNLLADVQAGTEEFGTILVYDVSRWGRFQDADESAYYEFACRKQGKNVIYCAEPFENDASAVTTLLKSIKRLMAAEFSREIGVKTHVGRCRAAALGFWVGGMAPFGMSKELIDANGVPKQVLKPGQRKSIAAEKVKLAPGPPAQSAVVKRIFQMFVKDYMSMIAIAAKLNQDGVLSPLQRRWTSQSIRNILRNEAYVGNVVFNKANVRFGVRHPNKQKSEWIRSEHAHRGIVSMPLFQGARDRYADRKFFSDEYLLGKLRTFCKENAHPLSELMDSRPDLPNSGTYRLRYGSYVKALWKIGYVCGLGFVVDEDGNYIVPTLEEACARQRRTKRRPFRKQHVIAKRGGETKA